jgi:hypothetical protein
LRRNNQTVHDQFDIVLLVLVQLQRAQAFGQLDHLPIHTRAGVALVQGLAQRLHVRALASARQRGQQLEAPAGGQVGQLVGDLLGRLRLDGLAALRAVRCAQPSEQHAQVIQHLGDGADG